MLEAQPQWPQADSNVPFVQHSLEQELAGPTGCDGRETAPDAPSAELGERAYRGEVQQPRRPPGDE